MLWIWSSKLWVTFLYERGKTGALVLMRVAELIHIHFCIGCLVDCRGSRLKAAECVYRRRRILSWIHLGYLPRFDVDRHTLSASRAMPYSLRPLSNPS